MVEMQSVERFINKTAKRWSQRTSIPYQDCRQSLVEAFLVAKNRYDPSKNVKFLTFFYYVAHTYMRNYTRRYIAKTCLLGDMDRVVGPCQEGPSFLADLGNDARQLANLIVSSYRELVKIKNSTTRKKRIFSFLEGWGWDPRRIQEAFENLCCFLEK